MTGREVHQARWWSATGDSCRLLAGLGGHRRDEDRPGGGGPYLRVPRSKGPPSSALRGRITMLPQRHGVRFQRAYRTPPEFFWRFFLCIFCRTVGVVTLVATAAAVRGRGVTGAKRWR